MNKIYILPNFNYNKKEIDINKIYNNMKNKTLIIENKYLKNDLFFYKLNRKKFINLLFNLFKKHKFKTKTLYKTILYLDILFYKYLNNITINEKNYFLILLSCYLISIKFLEVDSHIPKTKLLISYFYEIIKNKYLFNINEIKECEIFCLNKLNYELNICTLYDFIHYYFCKGLFYYKNNNEIALFNYSEKIYNYSRIIINYIIINDDFYLGINNYLIVLHILKYLIEKITNNFNLSNEFIKNINQENIDIDIDLINKIDNIYNLLFNQKQENDKTIKNNNLILNDLEFNNKVNTKINKSIKIVNVIKIFKNHSKEKKNTKSKEKNNNINNIEIEKKEKEKKIKNNNKLNYFNKEKMIIFNNVKNQTKKEKNKYCLLKNDSKVNKNKIDFNLNQKKTKKNFYTINLYKTKNNIKKDNNNIKIKKNMKYFKSFNKDNNHNNEKKSISTLKKHNIKIKNLDFKKIPSLKNLEFNSNYLNNNNINNFELNNFNNYNNVRTTNNTIFYYNNFDLNDNLNLYYSPRINENIHKSELLIKTFQILNKYSSPRGYISSINSFSSPCSLIEGNKDYKFKTIDNNINLKDKLKMIFNYE